jgi:hypothetical protein
MDKDRMSYARPGTAIHLKCPIVMDRKGNCFHIWEAGISNDCGGDLLHILLVPMISYDAFDFYQNKLLRLINAATGLVKRAHVQQFYYGFHHRNRRRRMVCGWSSLKHFLYS